MDKRLLDIYSDYLISQSHHATATGLADLLNGEISHDKVSRFLRLENYESKELWSYIKPAIRQLLKKVFTNEDGSTGILYLATNDLTIDADRIYEVYQKRWQDH